MSLPRYSRAFARRNELRAALEREELRNIILRNVDDVPPVPAVPPPPVATEAEVVQHLNVSCDECGELPIVGTRYKSRTQPNYDVCQGCLEENHAGREDGFDVLERYRPSVATTAIHRPCGNPGRSISIHSLYELESQLKDDVEDVAFYVGTRLTCPELGATVRRVLRTTKSLKSVHIHIFGTEFSTATIVALAEGLQDNKSALSVSWNLLWNRHDPPLDARAASALQTLMETNTTMQYMFVHRQRGFGIHHPMVANTNTASAATENEEEADDPLADAIFEALAKTHLHTVRYSGTSPVQPHNQKKAWAAMIANPHLKRVKTIFASSATRDSDSDDDDTIDATTEIDTTSSQEYLELLQTDKKHCWLQRWTGFAQQSSNNMDTNHHNSMDELTEQERQESQKRWKVLQEVLDTKDLDKKVPVLYHLLRNQPECLLRVQLPIITDDDDDGYGEDYGDEEEDRDVSVSMVGNHHQLVQDMHMMDDVVRPMAVEQEEEQVRLDLEDDDTYDNLIWV